MTTQREAGRANLLITADTNLLVRLIVADDQAQNEAVRNVLSKASLVAVTTSTLCELAWVLRQAYSISRPQIAKAIELIASKASVQVNPSAVEAGLRVLENGGDFADGVIAHEGQWLGGEVFVSFDRKAVRLLRDQGFETRLLDSKT